MPELATDEHAHGRTQLATKEILIIAGPNGAGKTTFTFRHLDLEARGIPFVNADLIASGLDPTVTGHADVQAGRLMLAELDRLAEEGVSFAFETTLSGRGYLRKIRRWRAQGYYVMLVFLSLQSSGEAIKRVEQRVSRGGHHVPDDVVRRRYVGGHRNLHELYAREVDEWVEYDNSGDRPMLINRGGMDD